jgi:effector-binding domain-containing protein
VLDHDADVATILARRHHDLQQLVRLQAQQLSLIDALQAAGGVLAEVVEVTVPAMRVRSTTTAASSDDLAPVVRRQIQRLRRHLNRTDPGGNWTFAARFPLDLDDVAAVEVAAHVESHGTSNAEWPSCVAAQTTLVGPHSLLPVAYDAVLTYIDARGMRPVGIACETYHEFGRTQRTTITVPILTPDAGEGECSSFPADGGGRSTCP